MTTEWRPLPTLPDVGAAQLEGWEIEVLLHPDLDKWTEWQEGVWRSNWKFRGRPRQPKMEKMNVMCFINNNGIRYDVVENSNFHAVIQSAPKLWTRVPSEDKEIEVPDGN